LRQGALADLAGSADLWLDGGHNAAAGKAIAEAMGRLTSNPTHIICGMLKTKDVTGFLKPLLQVSGHLTAVSIPGEAATLSASETLEAATDVGFEASTASNVREAISNIVEKQPDARILICGSLYLAGHVLRENAVNS